MVNQRHEGTLGTRAGHRLPHPFTQSPGQPVVFLAMEAGGHPDPQVRPFHAKFLQLARQPFGYPKTRAEEKRQNQEISFPVNKQLAQLIQQNGSGLTIERIRFDAVGMKETHWPDGATCLASKGNRCGSQSSNRIRGQRTVVAEEHMGAFLPKLIFAPLHRMKKRTCDQMVEGLLEC
jgi:hypothetical protein